jgi:tripartite-type tricarboxylate transporter receptor subunit TctC
MENWYGLLAPAGIAPAAATRLEAAALSAIKSAKIQQHMRDGELRGTLDAAGFKTRIARDVAFWGPMIKQLGITAGAEAAPPK